MSFMKPVIEEFKKAEGDEYMVCSDCYAVIVSGEVENPDPQWDKDDMRWVNLVAGDSDQDEEFSRSDCDCCDSPLAGRRYQCIDLDSVEHRDIYRWRLSASGYLDCTDWSEADTVMKAVNDCLGMHGDGMDEEDLMELGSYLDGFGEFREGVLYGLAFTGNLEWNDGDASDEPIFLNPGGDIRDVVDVDRDVWANLGEDDRLEILNDCLGFMVSAAGMIGDDRMQEAGIDFHFTRNGHGAGFWDGDWEEHGDRLTELCKPHGVCELVCGGNGVMRLEH